METSKKDAADSPTDVLQKLGLTPSAAACYWLLVSQLPKAMPAAYISEVIHVSPASLFRALAQLETTGFIKSRQGPTAKHYRAETLSYALDNYALYQRQLAEPLIKRLHSR